MSSTNCDYNTNPQRFIGLDIESASLDARRDPDVRLWCVSFVEQVGRDYLAQTFTSITETKEHVESLLRDKSVTFIIFNASFDVAVLRVRGINVPPGRYICSRLMGYINDTQDFNSLEHVASTQLFQSKHDIKSLIAERTSVTKKSDVFTYDYDSDPEAFTLLKSYCEQDARLALLWFNQLHGNKYVLDIEMENVFFELELPYVEVIMEMEATGVFIDPQVLEELKPILDQEISSAQSSILDELSLLPAKLSWDSSTKSYVPEETLYIKGVSSNKLNTERYYQDSDGSVICSEPSKVYSHCKLSSYNPNSNHLPWVLMCMGWKPEKLSKKTGEPTTDFKVISSIESKYPFLKTSRHLAEVTKIKTTFADKISELTISGKLPILTSNYNQCETITTRLSCDNFNLQQVPSRTKLGKKIRECVVAPDGYDLWVVDLDSAELRILAYYLAEFVGEHRMKDAILNGDDLHQVNADAWGLESRQIAKKIFSVIYGGQAEAVGAYGNNGTPAEGQAILDKMKEGMPKIWELMEKIWSEARSNYGTVHTLFGNPITYPELLSEVSWRRERAQRQAFNAIIQGTQANINKEMGIRASDIIHKHGGYMAFAVHDEYGAYVPKVNNEKFSREANQIYQANDILVSSTGDWFIPVTGTWASGNNWNEAKANGG
jgi:DNA polymerase I-like protein with 3'-5' exonuclease and polymerase domains